LSLMSLDHWRRPYGSESIFMSSKSADLRLRRIKEVMQRKK